MLYCLKASKLIHDIYMVPCPDCKVQEEYERKHHGKGVPIGERDEFCFRNCTYKIIEEIMDEEQKAIYNAVKKSI